MVGGGVGSGSAWAGGASVQVMVTERSVSTKDGRALRAYDAGGPPAAPVLVWHHGSPQTGAPLAPVVRAASERGLRVLSSGRPSYGGSDPRPGRDVPSAAADTAAVADAFGVRRFAVMGALGGGPHALACAALLPDRVTAAVLLAGPAPYPAVDFDCFAGMAAPGGLRAAIAGRASRAGFAPVLIVQGGLDRVVPPSHGAWLVLQR